MSFSALEEKILEHYTYAKVLVLVLFSAKNISSILPI